MRLSASLEMLKRAVEGARPECGVPPFPAVWEAIQPWAATPLLDGQGRAEDPPSITFEVEVKQPQPGGEVLVRVARNHAEPDTVDGGEHGIEWRMRWDPAWREATESTLFDSDHMIGFEHWGTGGLAGPAWAAFVEATPFFAAAVSSDVLRVTAFGGWARPPILARIG